jgi:hypothetical protein
MLWARVDRPGELWVRHVSSWPALAIAQLVLFAGLLLLSLPKRRTVDPDADPDADAEAGADAGADGDGDSGSGADGGAGAQGAATAQVGPGLSGPPEDPR